MSRRTTAQSGPTHPINDPRHITRRCRPTWGVSVLGSSGPRRLLCFVPSSCPQPHAAERLSVRQLLESLSNMTQSMLSIPYRLAGLVVFVALTGCQSFSSDEGPCVVWTDEIRPLTVGDTTRVQSGSIDVSDCIPEKGSRFNWSTTDPEVVSITEDGVVRGRAPGTFRLSASNDDAVVHESGFVLPVGWAARITPDSAVVQVGDSVTYRVVALDAEGRELPPMPFSLYTPEFGRPGSGDRPLVDKYSFQEVIEPSTFRAVRSGRTVITGRIGDRRVTAVLTILE